LTDENNNKNKWGKMDNNMDDEVEHNGKTIWIRWGMAMARALIEK
jgi:hypothetical protein